MTDWNIALLASAAIFGAFLVWKLRPRVGGGGNEKAHLGLVEAERRIQEATTDNDRASALCEAGDICLHAPARVRRASDYYLRAMRAAPSSVAIVQRVVAAFQKRPRALEVILTKRLALEPWAGENRDATVAVIKSLIGLYDGRLHNPTRAKMFANATALFPQSEPPAV